MSITLISLLAVIVLVSVNPTKQLSLAQDLKRQQDIAKIQQALDRYSIRNNGQYPSGIVSNQYKEICGGSVTTNCVDLSVLAPTYLSSVPVDPTGSNYKIALNPNNSGISLWSDKSVNREISVNQFISATAVAKDSTFDTGKPFGFSNYVDISTSAIQTDDKIIVGGSFSYYQGVSANSIARLNTDGSIDSSFNVGTGFFGEGASTVKTIVVQGDGKILAGGYFTSYNGVAANRIVRLNSNGSRDTSFNIGTGFNMDVRAIALQTDGKIVVGGSFTSYNGVASNRIIRLNSDGSRDTSFNIGTGFSFMGSSDSGIVFALAAQNDGKILASGQVTSYNGVSFNHLIRLNSDGSRDSTFNVEYGFNSSVNSISLQSDGKILVGGQFTSYQSVGSINRIVRLNTNATRDTTFNIGSGTTSGFTNESNDWLDVQSIKIQGDGKILVGGSFKMEIYIGVRVNSLTRLTSTGSIDTSFTLGSGFDGGIDTTATQSDGKIIVGGEFYSYNGEEANSIVRLNSDGTRDTSFNLTGGGISCTTIYDVVIASDGKLLLGGQFYNDQTGNYQACLSRLNSNGSKDASFNVGTGFDISDSSVYSLILQSDGKIVVGGIFSTYQGSPANNILKLNGDGSRDSSVNYGSGFNNYIDSIQLQSDGKLLVGGLFGQYNNQTAGYLTRLTN